MRAHFELLAALLVHVRRAIDRELLDAGRQRNRATHLSAGALGRVHDLPRRCIEDSMVERLEPDADILAVHLSFLSSPLVPAKAGTQGPITNVSVKLGPRLRGGERSFAYSMMLATTPAP